MIPTQKSSILPKRIPLLTYLQSSKKITLSNTTYQLETNLHPHRFQVMVLLYLAYILVHYMWRQKKDPDNAAIPYLTALGDLLGSVFLGLAFVTLSLFGLEYGSNVQQ